MKKIFYYITAFMLAISCLSACSEDGFTTFQGEKSGIYIQRVASMSITGVAQQYSDSVSFSFASMSGDLQQYNITIPVKVMGNVAGYDRAFVLKVDESKSTAVRGTHFDYDESACIIPANAASVSLPVTCYRHADLMKSELKIEFYLESNDQFTVELESYKNTPLWNSEGDQICGSRYKVIFSELYTETFRWQIFGRTYYGTWSASKEQRLNAIMGWTHLDWENGSVPYGRMPFAAKALQKQLQQLADAGTPVIDDDGSYMQLPSPYEVDYSAYQ